MGCNTCINYELYKMITGREAWGYSGDIPCLRCKHYGQNDEYVPKFQFQSNKSIHDYQKNIFRS